jgi:hypothetical protein
VAPAGGQSDRQVNSCAVFRLLNLRPVWSPGFSRWDYRDVLRVERFQAHQWSTTAKRCRVRLATAVQIIPMRGRRFLFGLRRQSEATTALWRAKIWQCATQKEERRARTGFVFGTTQWRGGALARSMPEVLSFPGVFSRSRLQTRAMVKEIKTQQKSRQIPPRGWLQKQAPKHKRHRTSTARRTSTGLVQSRGCGTPLRSAGLQPSGFDQLLCRPWVWIVARQSPRSHFAHLLILIRKRLLQCSPCQS